ncbi:MAG: nicotinate-nucleotide--dimethylbenzimidazole phosphoribosyltransferase [Clostridia bacterium]|nr:nicotinate-nucleotide--dimethylbenzimidazole phosphoribosyltransferase [Clostridia bacterium]
MSSTALSPLLSRISPPDEAARREAQRRFDACAKPLGSLGRLEEAVAKIAALTGSADLALTPRALLILCADNGVVAQGVTQSPPSVTAAVMKSMGEGRSPVCAMARVADCAVAVVDVGVLDAPPLPGVLRRRIKNGSGDITVAPALTREETEQAILLGAELAAEQQRRGVRLLATGEMGIGNTTTSTALACALLGLAPAALAGRGAGLSDAGLTRKIAAIDRALARARPDPADPVGLLSELGGIDLAVLTGVFLGCAALRLPVLVDGLIGLAAALTAVRLCPAVHKALLASHLPAEPAGALLLEALDLKPLLTAELRLGEGSGAVAAIPLLDMALAVYATAAPFEALGLEPYRPLGGEGRELP